MDIITKIKDLNVNYVPLSLIIFLDPESRAGMAFVIESRIDENVDEEALQLNTNSGNEVLDQGDDETEMIVTV